MKFSIFNTELIIIITKNIDKTLSITRIFLFLFFLNFMIETVNKVSTNTIIYIQNLFSNFTFIPSATAIAVEIEYISAKAIGVPLKSNTT